MSRIKSHVLTVPINNTDMHASIRFTNTPDLLHQGDGIGNVFDYVVEKHPLATRIPKRKIARKITDHINRLSSNLIKAYRSWLFGDAAAEVKDHSQSLQARARHWTSMKASTGWIIFALASRVRLPLARGLCRFVRWPCRAWLRSRC